MDVLALVAALVARTVFSFADPAIDESSGLVDLGTAMVTTNDSGDRPVLYVIDPRTGATIGTTVYARSVLDVEALAPAGHDQVWAADIGDNRRVRAGVTVYRVPVGRGDRRVEAPAYRLVYPDGAHDAESLVVGDGRLYLITKGVLGGTVYAAPRRLDPTAANQLRKVGRVSEWATDAALFPDRRHVLVRGYRSAEVRTFPGFAPVATFDLPVQKQGEGVSIGAGGRIRLSSEGEHSDVLQIRLPADVRDAMQAATTPSASPTPTSGTRTDDDLDEQSSFPTAGVSLAAALAALIGAGFWITRRRRP